MVRLSHGLLQLPQPKYLIACKFSTCTVLSELRRFGVSVSTLTVESKPVILYSSSCHVQFSNSAKILQATCHFDIAFEKINTFTSIVNLCS